MIRMSNKSLCENCFAEIGSEPCSECGFDRSKYTCDPAVLPIGSVLEGRYMIGRVIGKGGFGITYLAYDMKLGCKVAVKEYYPYGVAVRDISSTMVTTSADTQKSFKDGADRFYNEARLVAGFNGNPNIVSVYDFFYGNDTVYFTMGYLQGINLKAYINKNGAITPGQAVFLANEVSNALITAHNANVLHRDISPDNIMLCNDGTLKLLDFGAARQVIAEGSQSLSVILKQGYAPLEQYQKKGKQGPWTDIYSLGATLYYALTLDLLDDPMSRLEDDEEYSSNVHNIPDELWEIIKKATELKITDRYQDIYEFKEAFADISIKPEPFIKRDFKQQAENYRKAAHSRTKAVKTEKPASDVTVPLQQSGSAMDVTTPLNQSSSAPMDVTMPLNQGSSAPMDVTMPLNQSSSAPMDVTMPLNQSSSAPMDVTMPLNQGGSAPMDVTMPLNQSSSAPMDVTMPLKQDSSAPMDVTMPLKQDSSAPMDVTMPLKQNSSDMNVTMPLKQSSSAEEKTTPPERKPRTESTSIFSDRSDPEADAYSEYEAEVISAKKKRIRLICIIAAVAVIAVIMIAFATAERKYGDYMYYPSKGNIIITEYIGSGEAAVIPSEIKGKPVTLIGKEAFRGSDITSVTIPDSVTEIGESAFHGSEITSVTIPDSVTAIGYKAFAWCDSLTSVSISDSVTSIDYMAFAWCDNLKFALIPEGCDVDEDAFYGSDNVKIETRKGSSASGISDNLTYEISEDGNIIITGSTDSSYTGSIVIPDKIDGKPVTSIGDNAFNNCIGITGITIPNSVKYIGIGAFSGCNGLTSITIPDSVTAISDKTFYSCKNLTSITIPDSVTAIGDKAIHSCISLKSVTIPDSVKSIGDSAFSGCSSLTSITIPDSVTSIGKSAFYRCEKLRSVTIPDSVKAIERDTFNSCYALENASLPAGCDVHEKAFSGCSKVKIETRGNNSSDGKPEQPSRPEQEPLKDSTDDLKYEVSGDGTVVITGLKEYTFPQDLVIPREIDGKRVTAIGENAFSHCSFTTVTIPDSVTSIGDYSFQWCTELTSVTIPNSVTYIGHSAFYLCESLTSVTIPDSMTSIGYGAFRQCYSLTSVTIPDSVTYIDQYAFDKSDSLTSIFIPDSVTYINEAAFSRCNKLVNVSIPKGCQVEEKAFTNSPNVKIEIREKGSSGTKPQQPSRPAQETSSDNTDDLKYEVSGDGTVVITGLKETSSAQSLVIPREIDGKPVTAIGEYAFKECKSLTSVTIPDSVTSIGKYAFWRCESLSSITIPNNVRVIGSFAFSFCSSLTSITIPDSVTDIGKDAFYYCDHLTSIAIPDSVTDIGESTFAHCRRLKSITIPNNVKSIGYEAFYNCNSLTSIIIPNSVTSIGDEAFAVCDSLTSVTISDSVTSIGYRVFWHCESLTSVTIPDSVTYIGNAAFENCYKLKELSIPTGCNVDKNAFEKSANVKIEIREKGSSGTKPQQSSQPKQEESKPEAQPDPSQSEPRQPSPPPKE
ncbi:MAG: leucine-rich repeat protein [Huintestinicola sp.]|uniref:leucine-rich repeat protein n=1 Tax=Huintestinicola sp. TaxID=2981661 RepID=UPI003F11CBF8